MIRQPAVAGQFYYYEPEMLEAQVRECLEFDVPRVDAKGVVSPHAGLMYSGKVAGAVYSRINTPDTFIILGPNHSGFGAEFSIMTEGVWRMPFGEVRIDSTIAKEVFKHSGLLKEDQLAHAREHSLEVQLPFMQYLGKEFQIVPIVMRHYPPTEDYLEMCGELADAIASVVGDVGSKITLVASTDFTHYEPQAVAEENDQAAINAILGLDAGKLFNEIRKRDISMCGYGPVAVTLQVCGKLGSERGELVKYMTSGDTTGDYSQVVGYGGVIIK
jgi:AmmeMemoRadiSam system protein B